MPISSNSDMLLSHNFGDKFHACQQNTARAFFPNEMIKSTTQSQTYDLRRS